MLKLITSIACFFYVSLCFGASEDPVISTGTSAIIITNAAMQAALLNDINNQNQVSQSNQVQQTSIHDNGIISGVMTCDAFHDKNYIWRGCKGGHGLGKMSLIDYFNHYKPSPNSEIKTVILDGYNETFYIYFI
jgi:hypothetical protein